MKFKFIFFNKVCMNFYKTILCIAIEKGNTEIVKLLLTNNKLDINLPCIYDIKNDF